MDPTAKESLGASTSAAVAAVASARRAIVALVGNPNTGKTTLFNALAGMRQRVGNYPGVTVETKKGKLTFHGRTFDLVDLPGTYSLAPRSPDEMVAVDLILGHQQGEARPDVVVSIVDASNLERNLYLTTQVLELGVPVVVALNMIDVAEGQGTQIDVSRLQKQLGLAVVPIQANRGKGLEQLKEAVARAAGQGIGAVSASSLPAQRPRFPEAFERETAALHAEVGPEVEDYLVRRALLDVGGHTERCLADKQGPRILDAVQEARQRLALAGCGVPGVEARARYAWIRDAAAGCIRRPDKRPVTWTDRIDRILTHKLWGTLLFALLMFVVFQSIFTWAKPLMDFIKGGKELLASLLRERLPAGPLTSLLLDGVLEGVGSVLVFLPQIVILFGFIAVLEDCGYMARAAFLMDRLMARCGLSGKSFIPLLSSVACAVPGIMATRVIENRRDRLATILVAPLMSCSARLPVYALLIGAFLPVHSESVPEGYPWWTPGLTLFALYAIGLVTAPLVALALKRTLLRGAAPVFVMEMPLYKRPSPWLVARRMWDSGCAFIRRAGTLIAASMIVVWALLYFPASDERGQSYDDQVAQLERSIAGPREQLNELKTTLAKQGHEMAAEERDRLDRRIEELEAGIEPVRARVFELQREWKAQSILGRMGRGIEPVVAPLGWDWRIGVAVLASFPAREVVVGTLGIIYQQGRVDPGETEETEKLGKALLAATWDDDKNQKVFTLPVAVSVMVFFALCCQCASTLAVIRRETGTWRWPAFTFVYMTVLAYVGALVVYQVGSHLS